MNLLIFGDFLQLPPVGNLAKVFQIKKQKQNDPKLKNVFKKVIDVSGKDTIPLLWRHFDYYELKTIVRQKDKIFCKLLNNIRIGNLSNNDIDLLKNKVMHFDDKKNYSEIVNKINKIQNETKEKASSFVYFRL